MTFNDNAKIDSSKVRRRGRATGIAAGGGGLLVIGLFIVSQLIGVDVTGLAGLAGGGDTATDEAIDNCQTGADANDDLDCRLAAASDSLDTYWSAQSPAAYATPGVVLFDQQANTGCGSASSATGPFYCPADQTVYIDPTFYDELRTTYGATGGPLAEMYVIAHEWGHHIQNLSGTMDTLDQQTTGPASDGVRLELQADCFAGAWAGEASTVADSSGTPFLEPLTTDQVAQALSAAAAVGDDRIQEASTGQVNPESWTHGASDQRQKWFTAGFESGPAACDTFAVDAAGL
jgi:predicted metalloprotease